MGVLFLFLIIFVIVYFSKRNKNQQIEKERMERQKKAKEENEKIIKERIDIFNATLNAMNQIPINILKDAEHQKKNKISEMPEYKFSSITKSTSQNAFKDFIVIDVETTGLYPNKDDITEISAIKFKNYVPSEYMTTLIKPRKEIPQEVAEKTGITNELVSSSIMIEQAISSFDEFIENYNIVGYNLEFDLKFLYANHLDLFSKKRKFYDCYELVKKMVDGDDVLNYKLSTICEYFNIYRNDEHRALSDAFATGIIFRDLCIKRTESYEIIENNTFINE